MKSIFKRASPYADDTMNLPVKDVEAAIPFYENILGFQVVSRQDEPVNPLSWVETPFKSVWPRMEATQARRAASLKSTISN